MGRIELHQKTIIELLEMEARLKDQPHKLVLLLAVQTELKNRGRTS